ncbi:Hypothetical_protein [Hexamita inflata]|uniref:Hypothetical_protein n=1 Tax=Hexamita inflata TaxID=28002 RepID=A0AA86UJ35_9EUKA|nr:Hypothetical protein HINF_LOCUS45374 [Hexamita inflata]
MTAYETQLEQYNSVLQLLTISQKAVITIDYMRQLLSSFELANILLDNSTNLSDQQKINVKVKFQSILPVLHQIDYRQLIQSQPESFSVIHGCTRRILEISLKYVSDDFKPMIYDLIQFKFYGMRSFNIKQTRQVRLCGNLILNDVEYVHENNELFQATLSLVQTFVNDAKTILLPKIVLNFGQNSGFDVVVLHDMIGQCLEWHVLEYIDPGVCALDFKISENVLKLYSLQLLLEIIFLQNKIQTEPHLEKLESLSSQMSVDQQNTINSLNQKKNKLSLEQTLTQISTHLFSLNPVQNCILENIYILIQGIQNDFHLQTTNLLKANAIIQKQFKENEQFPDLDADALVSLLKFVAVQEPIDLKVIFEIQKQIRVKQKILTLEHLTSLVDSYLIVIKANQNNELIEGLAIAIAQSLGKADGDLVWRSFNCLNQQELRPSVSQILLNAITMRVINNVEQEQKIPLLRAADVNSQGDKTKFNFIKEKLGIDLDSIAGQKKINSLRPSFRFIQCRVEEAKEKKKLFNQQAIEEALIELDFVENLM